MKICIYVLLVGFVYACLFSSLNFFEKVNHLKKLKVNDDQENRVMAAILRSFFTAIFSIAGIIAGMIILKGWR